MRLNLLLFAASVAYGQQFEVATIKQPPPSDGNRVRIMMNGGPGSSDPGRIHYENVSLKMLLTKAYGVQEYQISGPDWLDSERFDIEAKLPDATTKEQFQAMLQNLLIERFKMSIHRDEKELPTYVLLVAKNGPKLKPSSVDPAAPDPGPTGKMVMGKDGFPDMRAGGHGVMMAMMMGRGAKMAASQASMQELAERLADQLGRPVVDQTGLTGKYEFELHFSMEGLVMPPPPPGARMAPPPGAVEAPSDGESSPTLQTAIQEQLGLRLESKKAPLDLIVIDHIEKVPTEN
jgi:uncharacterized protein (TIGR03435 family)